MSTAVLPDPLYADLNDPAKYHVERGVAVFRPHKRPVFKDGKPTGEIKYEVTDADLNEIVANSNASVTESYHYPRHTIGHVVPGLSEELRQPAKLIGVAMNYRVAKYPNGKPVVVADLYTKKDRWGVAQEFPYRSAEYNWQTKKIRGVARLLQDPALELGTLAYSDPGQTVVYAEAVMSDDEPRDDEAAGKPPAKGGQTPPAKPGEKGPDGKPKPGEETDQLKAVFGDLNPDEVVAAQRLVKWLEAKYPKLADAFKAPAGEVPDQRPAPAAKEDPAEPEETSVPPGAEGDRKGSQDNKPGAKPKADEAAPMSQNADPNKTVETLQAELNELRVERLLDGLVAERYQFDRADVKDTLMLVPADKRDAKVAALKKSLKKAPDAEPAVEVLSDAGYKLSGNASDPIAFSTDRLTPEQYQEACLVMEATEVKPGEDRASVWERTVAKVRGGKK
jgi:hypothetical protein